MARYAREIADALYYDGMPLPATFMKNVDEKTRKAIAESGGTYNNANAVTIGGAGIELQSRLVTAGVVKPGPGKNYILGEDDYFGFDDANRTLVQQACDFFPTPQTVPLDARVSGGSATPAIVSRRTGARFYIPLRAVDGARPIRIDLLFAVPNEPVQLPTRYPRMRLVRIDQNGEVTPHPGVATPSDDNAGWIQVSQPADLADWWQFGGMQTLRIFFTGFEAFDRSNYDYAVEWQDKTMQYVKPYMEKMEDSTLIYSIVTVYRSSDHRPA